MIVAGVVLYFLFRAKDWLYELVGGLASLRRTTLAR